MSIDGIGKRGGVAPGEAAAGVTPTQGSFELDAPAAAGAPTPAAATSDAFHALERGEISVGEYLDARVESAVEPLLSRLSPEQLEFVRAELRSALTTDPVLVELVRKTTGGGVGTE
jgi:hypothetical protein